MSISIDIYNFFKLTVVEIHVFAKKNIRSLNLAKLPKFSFLSD